MRYLYTILMCLIFAGIAFADSVTLQWDANSEPDLAGYRIFVREAHLGYDFSSPAWQGTETTCTIDSLLSNKDYRFVARAFDTEGYESGNSNEVAYSFGGVPDGVPPGIPINITITVTVSAP